jgi:FMN phosphatase YigB (HAD superfamily)
MIDTIFFWQDGVITTSIADTAIDRLEGVLGRTLDIDTRVQIRDWGLDLQLGRLASLEFCREALALTGASMPEQELGGRIQNAVAPVPGVMEVLQELKGKYGLWMIGLCPSDWLTPMAERLDLLPIFSAESILVCPESGLTKLIPDVFELAVQRATKTIEQCLLVAPKPAITTVAVNRDLNSILFADARRLRRELGLRKLLPPI